MASKLPEESLDSKKGGMAMALLSPIVLPLLLLVGWVLRHFVNKLVLQSSTELVYSLYFFILPVGIAFLVGVVIALVGLAINNQKQIALVSYFAAVAIGFLVYYAPDV